MPDALKILVLAGGPDRERAVSLQSGATVANALREAGHEVMERDVSPGDLSAIDAFEQWPGDAIFPALHGGWGEGGGLQAILDQRGLPYVGCRAEAAALCMDKHATKAKLFDADLPTLPFELIARDDENAHAATDASGNASTTTTLARPTIEPPLVMKARREGSSIGMAICHDSGQVDVGLARLLRDFDELLVEKFCAGMEITIGVLQLPEDQPTDSTPGNAPGSARAGSAPGAASSVPPAAHALPPIRIVPATEFYDYDAKYDRDDTQYVLEQEQLGLSPREIEGLGVLAVEAFELLGCRHMARVDFIVDEAHRPWILEVNTIPGFTSHSLLPMAAAHAGIALPRLVDRLVRLAVADA